LRHVLATCQVLSEHVLLLDGQASGQLPGGSLPVCQVTVGDECGESAVSAQPLHWQRLPRLWHRDPRDAAEWPGVARDAPLPARHLLRLQDQGDRQLARLDGAVCPAHKPVQRGHLHIHVVLAVLSGRLLARRLFGVDGARRCARRAAALCQEASGCLWVLWGGRGGASAAREERRRVRVRGRAEGEGADARVHIQVPEG